MQRSNKLSTRKNYDLQWQRWASGCLSRAPQVNPLEYDPAKLVEFLTINKDLSPQQLNCIRSAVASEFRVIHPEKPAIVSNILLQQYFQAKRRNHYKLPYSSQEVYDVQPIITMVQSWGKTSDLGLDNLQQKMILLFTIASMWRPKSDNGNLQYRDITFKHDDQGLLLGVTLVARSPKEIDIKTLKLGALENKENCPVYTLHQFCKRTLHLRNTLPEDHSLFLANILETDSNKIHSASLVTIANWIKTNMGKAGIDTTKFKAHSLRSASSTKAVSNGTSIQSVKMHANWSLNSNTFEKYYFKPRDQYRRGRTLTKKVFEPNAENITTSDFGVEPTAIVCRA